MPADRDGLCAEDAKTNEKKRIGCRAVCPETCGTEATGQAVIQSDHSGDGFDHLVSKAISPLCAVSAHRLRKAGWPTLASVPEVVLVPPDVVIVPIAPLRIYCEAASAAAAKASRMRVE